MPGIFEMEKNTLQHYVPQFILNGFIEKESNQLFVFDKLEKKEFKVITRYIAAENGFYDLDLPDVIFSIDPGLSELESRTSSIIKEIVSKSSIESISEEDHYILAVFVASQHLRTKQFRNYLVDLDKQFASKLQTMGIDPFKIENYRPYENDDEVKIDSMRMLSHQSMEIARVIKSHNWYLIHTTDKSPFIISDNPVVLYNEKKSSLMGTIGFAVPGIEIYYPLTKSLALYVSCKSNFERFYQQEQELDILKNESANKDLLSLIEGKLKVIEKFKNMNTIEAIPEIVLHQNSLQVFYSERWLFSSNGDFNLVKEMLNKNVELKHGPRTHIT